MLSLRERALEEGVARGIAIGMAEGEVKKSAEMAKKLKELQQLGLDANEILRILTEAYTPPNQPASV